MHRKMLVGVWGTESERRGDKQATKEMSRRAAGGTDVLLDSLYVGKLSRPSLAVRDGRGGSPQVRHVAVPLASAEAQRSPAGREQDARE